MSKIFKSKAFIISAVIVLFLIIAGGLYYFGYYKGYIIKPKLEIVVNGGNEYSTNIYEEYEDKGVTLNLRNKEVPKEDYSVVEEDNVDVNTPGEYEVTYRIFYNGVHYKKIRKVIVKDLKGPEITTNVDKVEKFYCNKQNKVEITATAIDNVDGDVSANITREEKEDKLVLKVSDAAGNETVKNLPIEIEAEPAPMIKLNGNKTIYVVKGNAYNEKGATATDGCGNPIEEEITTSGSVDTNTNGNYTITYTVKYKEMEGTETRTVKVVDRITSTSGVGKTVYLTFDDGPGGYTQELLDILDKYDVKVTFFVTNQFPKYQYLIGEEAKRGHSVAVHTLTHKWDIYSSYEAYRADFDAMNNIIEGQTGYRSKLFRFPGGSSNTVSKRYKQGVVTEIKTNMEAEGFVYFDWNVDSNDAGGAGTQQAYQNVINGMARNTNSVVLMHDIHKTTIPAVEMIIQYGIDNGYTFAALTENSPTAHHGIRN